MSGVWGCGECVVQELWGSRNLEFLGFQACGILGGGRGVGSKGCQGFLSSMKTLTVPLLSWSLTYIL